MCSPDPLQVAGQHMLYRLDRVSLLTVVQGLLGVLLLLYGWNVLKTTTITR